MANKKKIVQYKDISLEHFTKCLEQKAQYTVFAGSRQSGKTMAVAMYVLSEMLLKENSKKNALVARDKMVLVKGTIWEDFINAAMIFGIDMAIHQKKSTPVELILPAGNRIVFKGLADAQRLKGERRAGQKFTWVIIEEAQNIPDEDIIDKLEDTAFREGGKGFTYIIMNTDVKNWVYDKFFARYNFEPDINQLERTGKGYQYKYFHDPKTYTDWVLCYSSIWGNRFLPQESINRALHRKSINYEKYLIDFLGVWGNVGTAIYGSLIPKIQYIDKVKEELVEHTIGIDYGTKNSATVAVHIAYSKDFTKVYLLGIYYFRNGKAQEKNANDFANDIVNFIEGEIMEFDINYLLIIVDSAADTFRQYLDNYIFNAGIRNYDIIPTLNKNGNAGKFPVLERIDLHRTLIADKRFFVLNDSNYEILIQEMEKAIYDINENTNQIKGRVDKFNDCLDALEYALMNRYATLTYIERKMIEDLYSNNKNVV